MAKNGTDLVIEMNCISHPVFGLGLGMSGGGLIVLSIIENNPFRILGVPASANYQEVRKAVTDIQRANKLNTEYTGVWQGTERLRAVKRTTGAVNLAFSELEDPYKRLQARLLWFQTDYSTFIPNLLNGVANITMDHDRCLDKVLKIAVDDPSFRFVGRWYQAAYLWQQHLQSQALWDYLREVEQKAEFPKPIFDSDLDDLMKRPPSPILHIWRWAARTFIADFDLDGFLRLDNLVLNSPLADEWREFVSSDIAGRLAEELETSYGQILEILKKVNRGSTQTTASQKENEEIVNEAAIILLKSLKPNLMRIQQIPRVKKTTIVWAQELLATSLLEISAAYTWAHAWQHVDYLLEESASLVDFNSALGLKVLRRLEQRSLR